MSPCQGSNRTRTTGLPDHVRGENLDRNDNLYHMVSLNGKLALVPR